LAGGARHRREVPRAPRYPGPGLFHVTVKAAGPGSLFRDRADPFVWHATLCSTLIRTRWTCVSFCLMTNHLHLLIDVPDDSLSRGMHLLASRYAHAFNRRHGREGPVQLRRFHAVHVLTDAHLLVCFRYIARNPVEAGATDSPLNWMWSTYAGSVGVEDRLEHVDASRVIAMFGAGPAAVARLRRLVETPTRR
jgi:putative transposase